MKANFDLTWKLSAQGVFPHTEDVTSFLLHTAEMQVLARWTSPTLIVFALVPKHLPLCSKLSPVLCDPGSVQQASAPARLEGSADDVRGLNAISSQLVFSYLGTTQRS